MDKTVNKIGLTFFNAVINYILYRIVIFLVILTTNALFGFMKNMFKKNKSNNNKRSIGTSSIETSLINEKS